jgi:hypothetical protein
MASTSSNYYSDHYLEDIHISEKEKSEEYYLKDNIDYWIAQLVRDRNQIKTFRDYYYGIRNEPDFNYLTENFGIGTPSKLKFTSLIKPRVDALLGAMVSEKFTYRITATDDKTIDQAEEDRKKKLLDEIDSKLDSFVDNVIVNARAKAKADKLKEPTPEERLAPGQTTGQALGQTTGATKSPDEINPPDPGELGVALRKIHSKYTNNYVSDFEIAAQDILRFFENDINMDLKQKLKQLALDLLITGEGYWRVFCDKVGADPVLEIIKPENMFYNKNTNSQYIDTADAVVHREFLTRKEVLKRYGQFMDDDQKFFIFGNNARTRTARSLRSATDLELYYNDIDPVSTQKSYTMLDVLEVFHVEWLALNAVDFTDEERPDYAQTEGYMSEIGKTGWRQDKYEGIRISGSVYVNCGKSINTARSEARPYETSLSYGGICYNDRNGKPYSLVGALKDIQDIYDVTQFYRDVLIANSGVPGSRINIAGIPKKLGNDFMERLLKFMALKKNGVELIDPTEPGAQLFQHYGEFDNSVNGNSLQAIEMVLRAMEKQADTIAGTTPQMMGTIQQRDAVTNVETGIHQTQVMNEDIYELQRTQIKRLLNAMLNISKVCYRKGKKGSYIMGSESYSFQILPEKFCFSDFAISLSFAGKDEVKLQEIRSLAKELVKAQAMDPTVISHIVMSDSVGEIQRLIDDSWKQRKEENDVIGQAKQKIDELENNQKELEAQLNSATQQIATLKQAADKFKGRELDLKEKEINLKYQVENKTIDVESNNYIKEQELKEKEVQLQREQLYLTTGNAREVKNF